MVRWLGALAASAATFTVTVVRHPARSMAATLSLSVHPSISRCATLRSFFSKLLSTVYLLHPNPSQPSPSNSAHLSPVRPHHAPRTRIQPACPCPFPFPRPAAKRNETVERARTSVREARQRREGWRVLFCLGVLGLGWGRWRGGVWGR
ncbi:hypothetical protein P171DRAFT_134562 [Karstenula rhodostoma CBS 690.94]|uniref:Uncharacterized protein n=1 Tax=Karstenula rhodostoma CBS 690.94 TaxID=1392251 RepID=A0A9P4P9R6_9PLEO|nr:hypothetical protein P171DRAFT_134562 [Karstenula rhodostoma CBS 690.94]